MSRVSQLQAMLASGAAPAPSPATSSAFQSALANATGTATPFASNAGTGTLMSAATSGAYGATAGGAGASGAYGAAAYGGAAAGVGASGAGTSALPAGTPYAAEITQAARANGLDPALLAGLIKQESGFNASAGSSAGARGLTQLMPGTAASLGVTNVLDPVQSINGGARYLKQQLDAFGGDVTKALAAYNAGPGAVQRFGGVPPYAETQNYVRAVQANAAAYRGGAPSTSAALPSEI
ncbi:MAG TPA: lytic transglycosylase domain-containing protein [Solirubrobacter sp.]|nr:lytic transglycosylase domain-containing protein [Solirubrobacter sp.]